MLNPYAGVNFNTFHKVIGNTHRHATTEERLWGMYGAGTRHISISNYTPSHPNYTLLDNNGRFEMLESDIPSDVIQAPNSEKVRHTNTSMHYTCVGSTAETAGTTAEASMTWQEKFDYTLDNLIYPDGGGICIAHPLRDDFNANRIINKLDYDNRVLGMEIYNHRNERQIVDGDFRRLGYAVPLWDDVLRQGMKCFGFCSSDEHSVPEGFQQGDDIRDQNWDLGRSVLLVSEKSEHECLKAYREGRFYGAFYGDRIEFENIEFENDTMYVKTDSAEKIKFISYEIGNSGTHTVKKEKTVLSNQGGFKCNRRTIYVRAIAFEDANDDDTSPNMPISHERLYTQPMFLKSKNVVSRDFRRYKAERVLLL